MADHSKPTLTSTYANFLSEVDARIDDLAVGLDPALTTVTNMPTGSIRWNSASSKWEKWSGTAWGDLTATYTYPSINVTGNTTLGDASTDTLTINALAVSTPNNLNFDSNTLFIDATNNRVGVGTNTPGTAFDVNGVATFRSTSTFQAKPTVQITSAATNTVTDAFRVDSQSSGTPANGIGVGIEMAAETAAGNTEVGVTLDAVTTDVTAASEDFDFVVSTMAAGAAAAERLRVKSTGQVNVPTGGTYAVNGTDVLTATALGSGVTSSSLTTVGTIGTGTWQGTVVGSTYGGTGVNNAGRTLAINTNSGTIAFSGASTVMTFPAATTTLAGLGTTQTFTGVNTFTPAARTSGAASYFTVTTPADTAQTAATESIGASFTAGTRTWATGTLALQRERVFAAPTYAFAGTSTLTTAINVDIADPVAGTNATITNRYALRAGATRLTSTLLVDGTSTLVGNTDVSGRLRSSGNQSVTAWTTTGQAFDVAAATFTDTSTAAAGVVASRALNTFNQPTLASTNAITVTNAANVYIANAPAAGTNTTITNTYALWVDNGNVLFDGNLSVGGTATITGTSTFTGAATFNGAIASNGGITLGNAAADALTITSNTATVNNTLTLAYDAATTNTVVDVLSIQRTSSGTPANGIGAGLAFKVETTASNIETGATIDAVVTDVTATSEDFDITFNTMAAGAAAAERARITSGSNFLLGTTTTPAGAPAGSINFAGSLYQNGALFSGGAKGGGTNQVFYENDQTVDTNYTITSGKHAMSAGPITVATGVTVTVPTGSVWTIV